MVGCFVKRILSLGKEGIGDGHRPACLCSARSHHLSLWYGELPSLSFRIVPFVNILEKVQNNEPVSIILAKALKHDSHRPPVFYWKGSGGPRWCGELQAGSGLCGFLFCLWTPRMRWLCVPRTWNFISEVGCLL